MFKPVLYKENPSVVIPRRFLETEVYAPALEAFVLVCTDCVFFNNKNKTFLLARRKSKPMSDWWFIGGRSFAGENEIASVQRCVKREVGLDVDSERFIYLTMKRYFFKDRQQAPQDRGCDSLCYIFGLELDDREIALAQASLDEEEYDVTEGLKEFGPDDLYKEKVFPAIIDLYEYVFNIPVQKQAIHGDQDTWFVLYSNHKTLERSRVRVKGKPEVGEFGLLDRIPQNKVAIIKNLFDQKWSLDKKKIWCWSEISKMIGYPMILCLENSHGFDVVEVYFTVFPDGTVEHFSMIDQNKTQKRRPVRPYEERQFYRCIETTPNTSYNFVPVPLEGVD